MVKPGTQGHRYLLVMIDTFTGWVEAFPTKSESALVVVKKLLHEIIPRFGLPLSMGSNNGLAFIAQVTQKLAQVLKIDWKLHCAYQPQSSGQVECMNWTIKDTLTKLSLETGDNWVSLLPFALLRAKCTPYISGISPFEAMFGRPPPLVLRLSEDKLPEITNQDLIKSLQNLQPVLTSIH